MNKILFYSLIFFMIFSCKAKSEKEKSLVDAGSFLESSQKMEVENMLNAINKKGIYQLYVYTVIAEKYYKHTNYGEYIFYTLSKRDSLTNNNVLLYLSYDDKKIKIFTGNKAREILTDSLSQIAIGRLIPYFSELQYYNGIISTINYIDNLFTKRAILE